MLRSARRIILTGIGASGLVAQNFSLEADEDWLQCCRSARYACATRNSTGHVFPDDLLLAISYTGVRREIKPAADEMLRVGGKMLAITGFYFRMPCNSVLLIACIPLPKNKRQTVLHHLLCQRSGNVNGFAVHCADSAGSGTGTRTYSS
ncbi:SIS domain-containing protein [Escherichia coli]|nr:SIS domain-containing protein [Escherichia coli]